LDRWFGFERAEALRHRLADLRAASCIHELLPECPAPIDGSSQMVLEVAAGVRITFCPNHSNMPRDGVGNIDWSRTSRIKIISIEATHD